MRPFVCRLTVFCGVLVSVILAAGAGCPALSSGTPPPVRVDADLLAEYVVSDAKNPYSLAFTADGNVFYTEKDTGQIRVIAGGTLLTEPFATIPVNHADDRGLLGIALHPDFTQNNRVYVFYTRSSTGANTTDPLAVIDNRVVYFEANGDVASGGEIFVASLPANLGTKHVSGQLAFAADGKLLVAIGDLTAANSALDRNVLVGKILRYNDDGTIPTDNPIADSPLYARGFRDVRGLTIDPTSGTPFAIDRNDPGHGEINRILANKNYGWPAVVGVASTEAERAYAAANSDYVDPIFDTGSQTPGLVGGSFNPSTRYSPNTQLQYYYGEASNQRALRIGLDAARATVILNSVIAARFPSPVTDVAFTPAGTLYVACSNAIFRLAPAR